MLNTETKRHIDNARDILVGVVPNPTAQIDQITNALIYKFMDDMDQAAIKVGAEPSFFVKDLEQYAWSRLMNERVGNQERMNLYSEALVKFGNASQLPQLFRDIFKSSFLPYRSPEVLGLFLKEVNYFDYAHPEELGNAYEYLLQIMGSQGDAGQFRTPRHIIDFIVDVVNPTKEDKVLDPACGTAGFLISAYKHILKQHDGKNDPERKEKPLTPEQRRTLFNNFEGFDIDPSMVRIAQVNMYLHQFRNPKVGQYDTLSQDERWNDKYDVILANPPFMSPRGGIRPHNKFSIKSIRSEVLFVDYIMNHLRSKGRAGIIVPEGVIFKSDTAAKQLRKNLVEHGLYAVVSLPSGVFNPYAGVKTSILLIDSARAKEVDELLFLQINNDGYELGAQRRPISKNDLPEALSVLRAWREGKRIESSIALWVPRTKVAKSGDYNLSVSRYLEQLEMSSHWPVVTLEKLEHEKKIEFLRGSGIAKKDIVEAGKYSCIHYGELYTKYSPLISHVVSTTNFEGGTKSLKGDVLVPATTTADALGIAVARSLNLDDVTIGGDINIIRTKNEYLLSDYLALIISNPPVKFALASYAKGANILHIANSDIKRLSIPVPPLHVQEQIVAKLNGYQKIIDGGRQIIDNWKPSFTIDPAWNTVALGEVFKIESGGTPSSTIDSYWNGNINWATLVDIPKTIAYISGTERKITEEGLKNSSAKLFPPGTVLVSSRATIGRIAIATQPIATNQGFKSILPKPDSALPEFVAYSLAQCVDQMESMASGGTFKEISKTNFETIKISLPSLEVQQQIVNTIEIERTHVESARSLMDLYMQKMTSVIAELWSE